LKGAVVTHTSLQRLGTILIVVMVCGVRAQSAPPAGHDLSGVWLVFDVSSEFSGEATLPLTAWGVQRLAMNSPTTGSDAALDANDPTLDCFPPGLPYVLMIPTPFELMAVGNQLLQVFEYDHSLRRIHMDRRDYPTDLLANGMYQWMGYSLARWEGDVLVVETRGFNDRSWLDRAGHPHSTELRVRERLLRVDRETLVDDITIEDSKAYTQAWSGRLTFKLKPDWEILEHVCFTDRQLSNGYREYRERAWRPAATP
jgi:hypothetical protein